MVKSIKDNWKHLNVPFKNTAPDLVSIEELTDYTAVTGNETYVNNKESNKNILKINKKKKNKKKRDSLSKISSSKKRKVSSNEIHESQVLKKQINSVTCDEDTAVTGNETYVNNKKSNKNISKINKKKKNKKKRDSSSKISSSKKRKVYSNEIHESQVLKKQKISVTCDEDVSKLIEVNDETNCSSIQNDMVSWNIFNLPESIIKALHVKQYFQPTEIQALTLPEAMNKKKDILGAAETGSGKTLAFAIPIVAAFLEAEKNNVMNDVLWAVIVTPTRELTLQVKNHISHLCTFTNIKVLEIFGGLSVEKQNRKLNEKPQIIVGTPGRLWELIRSGNNHLSQINQIKYFVVDEADRMFEKNHFAELNYLLERFNYSDDVKNLKFGKHRQIFVFSATLTLIHEPPSYIFKKKKTGKIKSNETVRITPRQKLQTFIDSLGLKNPSIIDITRENVLASGITEYCIHSLLDEKDYYLYYILKTKSCKKIVFANSINCVKRLHRLFNILQCKPKVLFADMAQNQRLKNLDNFQKDPNGLLLATDVAARGLDMANINIIIHYQVPKTSETYVHRSGRSVRGVSKQGTSVLLCCPSEKYHYDKIRSTLGKNEHFPLYTISYSEIFSSSKLIVNKAKQIERLESKIRSVQTNASWMEKCAKQMDILIDDDEIPQQLNENTRKMYQKTIKQFQSELKQLMSRPILPLLESPRYPKFETVQSFLKMCEK